MSRTAIHIENLSKAYHIGLKENRADTLVGAVQGMIRSPLKNFRHLARMNTFKHRDDAEDIFWALRDVSFEIIEGEVVGIIGRNGAGKSTLLKILSRITEPTSGRAVIRGRVSSLLEVGTGFHQELSGRENVYLNGTILGMTRREIDRKFDEIVAFSGVEKFLDTPIKHYSSGMKVRLAFSVAAHLEPEILIIDEVLAVGDAEFQQKCLGKMHDVARCGRTVLFVSHNMAAVESLCTSAVLMENGGVSQIGRCDATVRKYLHGCNSRMTEWVSQMPGNSLVERITLRGRMGGPTNCFPAGESLTLEIKLRSKAKPPKLNFELQFQTVNGSPLFVVANQLSSDGAVDTSSSDVVTCELETLPLCPGDYIVNLAIGMPYSKVIERIDAAARFEIVAGDFFGSGRLPSSALGHVLVRSTWSANASSTFSSLHVEGRPLV